MADRRCLRTTIFFRDAGVTGHDVGVHIDRINRIGNGDFVVAAENIEDVTTIAFRAVRHKDLVVLNVDLAIAIIELRDCRS